MENHQFSTLDQHHTELFKNCDSTLLNFNVQSLNAHRIAVSTDLVLMRATVRCLTETRIGNDVAVDLGNYSCLVKNKRTNRAGGVAIYAKLPLDGVASQSTLKQDDAGDICSATIMLFGQLTRVVVAYINPGTSHCRIQQFFRGYKLLFQRAALRQNLIGLVR